MTIDLVKIEKLKVWYAVFGVVVDAWRAGDLTAAEALEKLGKLKDELDLEVERPS